MDWLTVGGTTHPTRAIRTSLGAILADMLESLRDRQSSTVRRANEMLKNYAIDTQHPDVSGVEHLQMLHTRSRLAEIENSLSAAERQQLMTADRALAARAGDFLAELSRFVDLAEERRRLNVPRDQWWWYLDVLALLPAYVIRQPEIEPASA